MAVASLPMWGFAQNSLQQRTAPAAPDSTGLPTLNFVDTPEALPYGQAPVNAVLKAPAKDAAKAPVRLVRPATGTFIDEPQMPEMYGFNWTYPRAIVQIDRPEMKLTTLTEAEDWPVTMYMRNGNLEGSYFSDNPGGSTMLHASFGVNGLNNWYYNQFISNENFGQRAIRTAYDEHNDVVYGLSVMSPKNKDHFGLVKYNAGPRVNPATGEQVLPLADVQIINGELPPECECSAFCLDPRDGSLIGVSIAGLVIRFDPVTGKHTVIFDSGVVNHTYFGGLAYSPKDNGFIWVRLASENGSTTGQAYYLINTEKKTCELLKFVPRDNSDYADQISSLIINEHYADPKGPQPATVTANTFAAHADNGSITVQIPSKTENGTTLSGNLKYYLHVDGITSTDGKSYIEATVTPGSVRTDRIEGLSDGMHRITIFTVTGDGHWSRPMNVVHFTGYDAPEMPQNVLLDSEYLMWDPVEYGIHGQDITGDDIEYEVWVDQKKIGTTKNTSYRMDFDPVELLSHLAAVYAVNHGNYSEGGFSNRVTVGKYRTVPATFVPEASDVLLATVIDSDGDDRKWTYNSYYEAWYKPYSYSAGTDNDWIFLPPLNFDDPDALYEISFDLLTKDSDNTVELRLCDSPVVNSGEIIFNRPVNSTHYGEDFLKQTVIASASGVKHLAFHTTDVNGDVYLRNVNVTKTGYTTAAPAAVTDLYAIHGDNGVVPSIAVFNFPTKTVAGKALPANADITVEVRGVYSNFTPVKVTGKPGERGSLVFIPSIGYTDIFAQPEYDGQKGQLAQASFWAGPDVPGNVKNFRVQLTEDPMKVSIRWDSPGNEGFHGGYASTDGLKYYLLVKKTGAAKWTRYNAVDYTDMLLTLNDDFEQNLTSFGVMTENNIGTSEYWDKDVNLTIGKAYTLPMRETMAMGTPDLSPVVTQTPTEEYIGSAGFANPAQLKPEYAVPSGAVIGLMPPSGGRPGKAQIELPYFSTVGVKNPVFIGHALIDKDLTTKTDIYARAYGVPDTKIGTWDANTEGEGYTPIVCKLPGSFWDKKWVQVYIDATFEGGEERRFAVLERYSVVEAQDNDMSLAAVTVPAHMRINRTATIKATVRNNATVAKPAPDLSLKVVDATGKVTETVIKPVDTTPIAADRERVYEFSLVPGADLLGDMQFSLTLPDDNDLANNVYNATGSVETGDAIICSQIIATRDKKDPTNVNIMWDEPNIFDGTEDMEDMASFDSGRDLGAFINIDGDGSQTYTWENWDFPGEEDPHGFIVFDDTWSKIPANSRGVIKAHSGNKFLLALSPLNYRQADDWLISPEVEPGSDVSFWLSTLNTMYGADMVGLYCSDGSTDTQDFQMVIYKRKDTEGWEEIKATLPETAKRFAIHFYSVDTFGIMVDDISYTPLGGIPTLHGFELIRNGETLKTFDTPVFTHTDTGVGPEKQRYNITPLVMLEDGTIGKGEISPTAITDGTDSLAGVNADNVDITVNGNVITVSGIAPAAVTVADTNGVQVPAATATADTATYRVASGIYLVKAGDRTMKVFIR